MSSYTNTSHSSKAMLVLIWSLWMYLLFELMFYPVLEVKSVSNSLWISITFCDHTPQKNPQNSILRSARWEIWSIFTFTPFSRVASLKRSGFIINYVNKCNCRQPTESFNSNSFFEDVFIIYTGPKRIVTLLWYLASFFFYRQRRRVKTI